MNQLLLVLITALVTGGISISGIWFGSRLTHGNEYRKWRRDHALEAYSTFLRAVDALVSQSAAAWYGECGTEEHAKQRGAVHDNVQQMHIAGTRIVLLSPDALQAPFTALTKHLGTEIAGTSCKCPKVSEDERQAAITKLVTLQAEFILAAREDLGVQTPLHGRWWHTLVQGIQHGQASRSLA
jgi:hypothetical protein